MSLLLNMLSRLDITFLPKSKRLLISWLQSPSAVILEPPKIKSATVSTISLSISHEVVGPDAMIFIFCHKGDVIRISEVIDISSGNLDSSLCFVQPSVSHDVLCIEVKKHGDNIQPCCTPFPIWNQSVVPCPVLTVAS